MVDIMGMLQASGSAAATIETVAGLHVYPRSVVSDGGSVFFLGRRGTEKQLGALMTSPGEEGFDWEVRPVSVGGRELLLGLGPTHHANARALRSRLPYTAPVPGGLRRSAGLGDRLGIATPGHIRALRHARDIFPVLAQQSIREIERTGSSPEQVLDAATWGVFQEGWRGGYGADADHLKTVADIDACAAAGFVLYTLDPRDHVDNDAETDGLDTLRRKFAALPWERLATSADETLRTYADKSWTLVGGRSLTLSEEELLRAACKYGRALVHLAGMYRHLTAVMGGRTFELEISVDEADTPTTPAEHYYIARELKRMGVRWVSLAPRYTGRFEKGVDYIGDPARFEQDFAGHVAVARTVGPYKLSLHSGSDKFSIYPIAARLAGDLIHLKTAGTSYLEALRAVARVDPALFREILAYAIDHYEADRVSYHVSAERERMPDPRTLTDAELESTLDQFDARQALHVTFGSVLNARDSSGRELFRGRLYASLNAHEETHYAALEAHIARHLMPFVP
ncbi:MAG: tagaturonate epimerase family protein [Anaerolineae bacterium]|jgi:hypothetical protein